MGVMWVAGVGWGLCPSILNSNPAPMEAPTAELAGPNSASRGQNWAQSGSLLAHTRPAQRGGLPSGAFFSDLG